MVDESIIAFPKDVSCTTKNVARNCVYSLILWNSVFICLFSTTSKQDYCSVWHHRVMSQQPCNSSRPPTVIYYHRISNGPIRESAKFWKFRRNDLPIVPNWPPRDTNWPHGLCDGRFGVKWRETISPISSLFFTCTIDHLNFPATNSPSWTRHFVNDSFLPDAIYLIGFLRIFTARKVHEMSFLAHSKTTWINRF